MANKLLKMVGSKICKEPRSTAIHLENKTVSLDFRFKEYTEVSHSDLIGFAKKLREFTKDITGKDVRILITRKQELCYEKKLKKEGMIYASGAHMYFLKHRFTKSEAVKIAFKFELWIQM